MCAASACDFAGFAKACCHSFLHLTLVITTKTYHPLLLHTKGFIPFFCYKHCESCHFMQQSVIHHRKTAPTLHRASPTAPLNSTNPELTSGACPPRGSRCPSPRSKPCPGTFTGSGPYPSAEVEPGPCHCTSCPRAHGYSYPVLPGGDSIDQRTTRWKINRRVCPGPC